MPGLIRMPAITPVASSLQLASIDFRVLRGEESDFAGPGLAIELVHAFSVNFLRRQLKREG
jgi:hypothetical protein